MAVVFSGARVSLGALCLVAMAGCGGRTSTFTPDDPSFGSSEPGGGSSGSSSGTAVHPTPSGGASSAPAGGAPSSGTSSGVGVAGGATTGGSSGTAGAPNTGVGGAAGGTSSSLAAAVCSDFCSEATKSCASQFGNYPDCVNSCAGELGSSDLCLVLGEQVIDCFLPFIRNSGGQCSNIERFAEAQCAAQLQRFQQCSDVPTPAPVPVPVPVPIPEPASDCRSNGSSSPVTCNLTSKCNDGSFYMVNCTQGAPGQSLCTCQSGNGSGAGAGAGFTLNESVAFACYDGISTCGGPVPTLPPG